MLGWQAVVVLAAQQVEERRWPERWARPLEVQVGVEAGERPVILLGAVEQSLPLLQKNLDLDGRRLVMRRKWMLKKWKRSRLHLVSSQPPLK